MQRKLTVSTHSQEDGELRVSALELPWSDLLLEIAMTTAFASLTEGTPILEASSLASYVSFFALVWWIWASQVAYNVRFRQADWLHRLFIFLQVFAFCGLATFTLDYDVTHDLSDDVEAEEMRETRLQIEAFGEVQRPWINVQRARSSRLPTLNARGISVTVGLSRVFLLVQYLIAYYHAIRRDGNRILPLSRHSAFLVHIGSLLFSTACYFIAFALIGRNPSEGDQIAKFCLWYIPLFVEVAAHFIATSSRFCRGRVYYDPRLIMARSSTVFVIILGQGLDSITNSFQFMVGNISFGWGSLGVIFCGVCTPPRMGSNRAIGGFFCQFFFLAAVIVTLQGIAAMLTAGNLGNALEVAFDFLRTSQSVMQTKGFSVRLNESDYASTNIVGMLQKQGIALESLLPYINFYISNASQEQPVDYSLPFNALLQMDLYIVETIGKNLDLYPDSGLLLAQYVAIDNASPKNYTLVSNETFRDAVRSTIVANTTPALWFYAAGGLLLAFMGVLMLITQEPRDRYEWGQILSRILLGSATISLSGLDAYVSDTPKILTEDWHYGGSGIWWLATHSWILPPYALALLLEQIVELVLSHLAGRHLGEILGSYADSISSMARAGTNSPTPGGVYSKTGTFDEDGIGRYKHGDARMKRSNFTDSDLEQGLESSYESESSNEKDSDGEEYRTGSPRPVRRKFSVPSRIST
ncbi:hypothetical protein D9758_013911 [Tetrapyrgos nigripes]|uniref:Uncharacterized protein n=1 Tax=Tetrapyrgos nigripes TaxID=182062 RepID=A0A8H5CPF3_9AGAR|nr:hypothetical protein D9758_013911 [Tetrapyrgos nigripes]